MSSSPSLSQWAQRRPAGNPSEPPSPLRTHVGELGPSPLRTARGGGVEESPSSSSAGPSNTRGLDSLLYNFYAKTIAVVIASRLTHWHDIDAFDTQAKFLEDMRTIVLAEGDARDDSLLAASDASIPPASASAARQATGSGSAATARKMNRWFGILLPELEIFRDEALLWKKLSNFVPQSALEASIETPADEQMAGPGRILVPPLILDVIFDPTQLGKEHTLSLVDSRPATPARGVQRQSSAVASTVEASGVLHRPIVLERWRIDFNVFPPDVAPDIRGVYQRCISHFRSMHALIRSLPTQRLYRRLRTARIEAAQRSGDIEGSRQSQDAMPFDHLLQIGCRLGAGEPDDEDEGDELGLKYRFTSSDSTSERPTVGKTEVDSVLETNIQGFGPVVTPLGSLNVSVEYRLDVDFRVTTNRTDIGRGTSRPLSTVELASGVASIDLQPDEDYFRPKSMPTKQEGAALTRSASTRSTEGPSLAQQVASQPIPVSSQAGSGEQPVRSASSASNPSPSSSLFSQSVPGRPRLPPAGLSSLRHQSSVAAMGNIATPPTIEVGTGGMTAPPSALASALGRSPSGAEPAFLTNAVRRASMGERKFRTPSNMGGAERPSPPSPSTGASSASMRPPIPHQMRFGSYSPSSSSPLAQRLSASQSQRQTQSSQGQPRSISYSLSPTPAGISAGSVSFADSRSKSPNMSLRSVFQDYLPRNQGRGEVSSPASNRLSIGSSTGSAPRPSLQRQTSGGSEERTSSVSSTVGGSVVGGASTSGTTSVSSRPGQAPSVAPQMIQRYSRTPSYRQERRTISTSIGESHAEDGGEVARGGSSLESNQGSIYSRSWQARTEARQAMIANAMQRGSLGGIGSGSPGGPFAREYASSPTMSPAAVQRSPSSASGSSLRAIKRRGSIQDLVEMIDSRPQAVTRPTLATQASSHWPSPAAIQRVPSIGTAGTSRPSSRIVPDRVDATGASTSRTSPLQSGSYTTSDRQIPHSRTQGSGGEDIRGSGVLSSPSSAIRISSAHRPSSSPGVLLSRSAVDEMLAKMSLSVSRLAGMAGRQGSGEASGEIAPTSSPTSRFGGGVADQHIEGGYGATSPVQHTGDARRPPALRGTGPPSPSSLRRLARLSAGRSQSSLELYSPETAAFPLHSSSDRPTPRRSSSSYDDGHQPSAGGAGGSGGDHASSFDAIGLVNFEEEEPTGRLELHSEPGTPHYSFARSSNHPLHHHSSNIVGGLGVQGRSGSAGPGHGHGSRGVEMEGGLGGLSAGPTDAERLRSFGEELGSTRGRRNLSPWTRSHRGGGAGQQHHPGSAPGITTPSGSVSAGAGGAGAGAFGRAASGSHAASLLSPAPSPGNGNNGNGGGNGTARNEWEREREYRERRERREASDQAWREYQRQRDLNRDW
ncbi:hypothetical protein BCV69DRAFT_311330 [Microstroma glucosiphilum]|uniref:Autophagy-related protein 13 n=1 Tax=Pseudomicrostroma glucosiphilum TaxID=1684307 RepID=A0A316UBJ6_9BASI|nr:hypothetical protein BCV69DRAFT_311330 [Pseudomicrostroma glucosiphilum]PWN22532.1 hypothetical protein BCV69DRAFT_311330 [Pseudomicrostroma glucosiphilum]